jgi:hypothetical protein
MGIQEFVKIVKQLIGRKIVNPAVEVIADTTHRSGIGLDSLRLQAVKLKAFQVLLVVAVELWIGWHVAVHSNLLRMESDRAGKAFLHCRLGFINKKPRGYYFQQRSFLRGVCRVAASSNIFFHLTAWNWQLAKCVTGCYSKFMKNLMTKHFCEVGSKAKYSGK